MKPLLLLAAACAIGCAQARASEGPADNSPIVPIPSPQDRPYPGALQLDVDAADVVRRLIHVHERISGLSGDVVLLYPKWLPGTHAPEGPIDRVAGLKFSVDGQAVSWRRDP